MRTLCITLPLPENRANARWHWRTEKRKREAYWMRCLAAYSKRPKEPLAPAIVDATFYSWNMNDEDNRTARLKWALDFLVDRQILLDDHPSAMKLGEVTQQIDRKNQRLELRIREVETT